MDLTIFVVFLLSVINFSEPASVRDWFLSQRLTCRFCEKKSQKFGLLPDIKKTRNVTLQFNPKAPKCELSERFLSFSLDTLELKRGLQCFPLNSDKINTLVKALAPAYIRVGGTPQDFLLFSDEAKDSEERNDRSTEKVDNSSCIPFFENWRRMKPFYYTLEEFESLYNFTSRNGLRLIFGLNGLTRHSDGSWHYERIPAKLFDKYQDKVDWQIGNEPNRFHKYGKNTALRPEHLARDKRKLRGLLSSSKAKIYGPDIADPSFKSLAYLKRFMESNPQVDAVTYHLYDMHQSKASLKHFLNPMYLIKMEEKMNWVENIVRNANVISSRTDIWIGETGSASGGGASGLSDRFVSGFLYLGKLGLASEMCHKVVVRQSFYGGYYGMLDPVTHDPLPDYWISVLFKRLARNIVLGSLGSGDAFLRTHFYCSNLVMEDVVVSFVNMRRKSDYKLTFENFETNTVEMFLFTNPHHLQSRSTYLNGKLLRMENDLKLPVVDGVIRSQPVHIPSRSYGFLIIRNVKAKACM